jgi:transposase-like protein
MAEAAKSLFECSYTSEMVCPHCGHELSKSWDYGESERVQCPECDKEFVV